MSENQKKMAHYRLQQDPPFLRHQRSTTTILCGGLTVAHEKLVESGLRAVGYKVNVLPTVDLDSYALGREHCSNGLCNPSYFTIGNLLKYLTALRTEQGLSSEEICERYVFYTAGSYGPCRFGMYESEYRLALASAGFPGFRVLVFQQSEGMVQSGLRSGLDFDPEFFIVHFKAAIVGDIVNEIYHQIKPYELTPGAADVAQRRAIRTLFPAMAPLPEGRVRRASNTVGRWDKDGLIGHRARQVSSAALVLEQLRDKNTMEHMTQAVSHFAQVKTDRFQVKPVVKVTGEFWAQTTESDGNFKMFEVLEGDGAEVLVEPLTTWIHYLLHVTQIRNRGQVGLASGTATGFVGKRLSRLASYVKMPVTKKFLELVEWALVREYLRLRRAAGDCVLPLADQKELEELAEPYFDPRLYGGEGHLEVGKTIHYTQDHLAHMVISLKPFGCMPSTQSDGVQPAVLADYPDILFLPVETSSDGEGAALSRVQMMLSEARTRARLEWREFLATAPYSLQQMKDYVAQHPELSQGLLALPRGPGLTTTACRFAALVCEKMQAANVSAEPEKVVDAPHEAVHASAMAAGGAA